MRTPAGTGPAICLALLLMSAVWGYAGDRIVGRVGNEPVTRNEVLSARSLLPDLSYEEALEVVVDRKVVLNWAGEQGMTVTDAEIEAVLEDLAARNQVTREQFEAALKEEGQSLASFKDSLREQLLINKAIGSTLSDRMRIGEEEIREAYAESYKPVVVNTVSHILFSVDPDAGPSRVEEARQKAAGVLARIEAGEPFEEMARAHSEDSRSAAGGGALGSFRQGELLAELEEELAGLSAGETRGPVRTRLGFHIIRLDSREQNDPPPLEDVREELRRGLLNDREDAVRNAWIKELRENTYIEIFEE